MRTLVMLVDIEECDFEEIKKSLTEWFQCHDAGMNNLDIFLGKHEKEIPE